MKINVILISYRTQFLFKHIPVSPAVSTDRVTFLPRSPLRTPMHISAEPFPSLVMMVSFSNPIVATTSSNKTINTD